MDMGRPPGVVMIAPRIGAGLYRDEPVVTLGVGLRAPGAGKIRIERGRMLVADVDVTAAGIGLPDLEQRIRHAVGVFVQHMAVHDDALAERLALVLGSE